MTQQARMPAPGINPDAVSYVAQVRAALADLSPDDLDDLTGGMAADLAELLRERGGALTDHLGTPAAYAAELRAAAGLPTPGAARSRNSRWTPEAIKASFAAARAEHPILDQAVGYAISLRPAWWFLRGAVAAGVLVVVFGLIGSIGGVVAAMMIVLMGAVLSVVIGLRTGGRAPSLPGVVVNSVLGAAAALMGIAALGTALNPSPLLYQTVEQGPANVVNTSNLFVYDSAGKRVDGARVFTAEGEALRTAWQLSTGGGLVLDALTRLDVYGVPVPDAYPHAAPGQDPWTPASGPDPHWTPPASLPPLAPLAKPTPSPGASSPAASTVPMPNAGPPSSSASTAPSPGPSASTTPAPNGPGAVKPTTPAASPTPTKGR